MIRHYNNEVNNIWYLYSCILRHIYNNRELFLDIRSKNYKFMLDRGEIIYLQEVSIIYLLF